MIRDRYSGTLFQQENKSDHETCRVGNYVSPSTLAKPALANNFTTEKYANIMINAPAPTEESTTPPIISRVPSSSSGFVGCIDTAAQSCSVTLKIGPAADP